jgi:nucleotide-binding universal stress UspA family protein
VKLEKILVAVDFSICSDTAFSYAKALAKKFSARIELLHVVNQGHTKRIADFCGESEDKVAERLCLQAKKRFEAFMATNDLDGIGVEQTVAVGIPFQTIALKAQERAVDMIIMGGHGRKGSGQIEKIFFGSNAERVVRILPCPVLCVPPESPEPS